MAFKQTYQINQFPNQTEYAKYMMKCILDETMVNIQFNGTKSEFLNKEWKKFLEVRNHSDKQTRDELKTFQDYIVVKTIGTMINGELIPFKPDDNKRRIAKKTYYNSRKKQSNKNKLS